MHLEGALLGILIGWLRGGKIRRLTGLTLPGWPLAVLGLGLQLLIRSGLPGRWESIAALTPLLHIISFGPLLWFILLNRNRRGLLLMGLGLLLNLIVIAANRGFMPVNLSGLAAHLQEHLLGGAGSPLHAAMTAETILPLLGDQLRIAYGRPRIVSIGDLLLALGLVVLIQHYMVTDPAGGNGPRAGGAGPPRSPGA